MKLEEILELEIKVRLSSYNPQLFEAVVMWFLCAIK